MSTTSGRRHNSDVDHEKDGRQSASRRRQGVTIKCDAVVWRHATYSNRRRQCSLLNQPLIDPTSLVFNVNINCFAAVVLFKVSHVHVHVLIIFIYLKLLNNP